MTADSPRVGEEGQRWCDADLLSMESYQGIPIIIAAQAVQHIAE